MVLTQSRSDSVFMTAPCVGRVRFHAPSMLTGELEVYDSNETLADVEGERIAAPAHGFVVRRLVRDDATVEAGFAILEFRIG